MRVFDRALAETRRRRKRGAEPNVLTRTIGEELAERLSFISRSFERALVIAAEPETIAARLLETGQVKDAVALEPPAAEDLDLAPEGFDAVFSVLDLQSANDVPGGMPLSGSPSAGL